MKVFLVSANPATTPYPVYPLGMSVVAAALVRAGHEVRQFDFLQHGESLDALGAAAAAFGPGVAGLSMRNLDSSNFFDRADYLDGVRRIVARLREASPAPVVLGGSGFSVLPEAVLRATGADYGIAGEGERAFVEFVEGAARGAFPPSRVVRAPPVLDGGELCGGAYDPDILRFYLAEGTVAPVQTKRGCRFRCAYCSYPLLEGRTLRARPAAEVVDDVERLFAAQGARQVFFTDSVFNDPEGRFREVVAELRRRGLKRPWTAFFRPAGLAEADVAAMCETGLCAAELGSDAATDTTLAALGKDFTFRDVEEAGALFARHGATVAHYFMFGGPGETRETVVEGIANVRRLGRAAVFAFMGIRLLPGTPLAERARREGVPKADGDLLEPAYYFAPGLDPAWLERTLAAGFEGLRHVVFPPDSLDSGLRFLHRLGYSGSLVELLLRERGPRGGPPHAARP